MSRKNITALDVALEELRHTANLMGLDQEIVRYLKNPHCTFTVDIPVRMDDGELRFFTGYRVQHNSALGPCKGGTRFHPDETLDDVKALAFWMTVKNSLAGLRAGGGKGGIVVDPLKLSQRELEQLSRGYIRALFRILGPQMDIPGPDVGTPPQVMAWFTDEYELLAQKRIPAAIAGKPPALGGSLGRSKATSAGLVYSLLELLRLKNDALPGKRVCIQGFGNVGGNAARILAEHGAVIVGLCDVSGGVYAPEGIDVKAALAHVTKNGVIKGLSGYEAINAEAIFGLPCDILVPAALQNQIHEDNATEIQASIVVEGANGPSTPAAESILLKKGCLVLPDIAANAGGTVVSYFEMVQNLYGFDWTEEEVLARLEDVMSRTCRTVYILAMEKNITLRSAAWIVAIGRVAETMRMRGWVRTTPPAA